MKFILAVLFVAAAATAAPSDSREKRGIYIGTTHHTSGLALAHPAVAVAHPVAYHAPIAYHAPLAYHAPIAYHAPVAYHAPIATSYSTVKLHKVHKVKAYHVPVVAHHHHGAYLVHH